MIKCGNIKLNNYVSYGLLGIQIQKEKKQMCIFTVWSDCRKKPKHHPNPPPSNSSAVIGYSPPLLHRRLRHRRHSSVRSFHFILIPFIPPLFEIHNHTYLSLIYSQLYNIYGAISQLCPTLWSKSEILRVKCFTYRRIAQLWYFVRNII